MRGLAPATHAALPAVLLRAVSSLDEATRQRELGRLVEAELLYQRGLPPQATCLFKHALIITLAREQGFAFWLASGTIFQGWALVEQGQRKEGIARMREGLSAYEATGARLATTLWMALLGEGYGRDDQVEEGLALLERALALANETGERIWEAELHRLKGDLLLRQGSYDTDAEQHFSEALEVARRQGARSWERRAAESLAQLPERQRS